MTEEGKIFLEIGPKVMRMPPEMINKAPAPDMGETLPDTLEVQNFESMQSWEKWSEKMRRGQVNGRGV
jgi:hypothetical protein